MELAPLYNITYLDTTAAVRTVANHIDLRSELLLAIHPISSSFYVNTSCK